MCPFSDLGYIPECHHGCDRSPAESPLRLLLHGLQGPTAALPLRLKIYQGEIHEGFVLGSAKRWSPDLVNFATALAYHFFLALPAVFTQPKDNILAEPCARALPLL